MVTLGIVTRIKMTVITFAW